MDLRTLHPEELAPWHRALSGDFPAGECKPLEDIRALIAQGRYEILGRFQREALCGYAALWRHEDFPSYVMLDYLGGGGPPAGGTRGWVVRSWPGSQRGYPPRPC